MLRVVVRIVVAALLVTLASFVVTRYVHRRHAVPSRAISPETLPSVIAAARAGDGNAAVRLSHHYAEKGDPRASWIWMQRAKRLGFPGADASLKTMREVFPPDALKEDDGATK